MTTADTSWINLKRDCLAVGDGKADDTVALQSALDQLQARGQTGKPATLYIPPGTYRITDGLRCKTKWYLHIQADNATITASGNMAGKAMLNLSGTTFSRVTGLRMLSSLTGDDRPAAVIVYGRDANGTGGDVHLMDCGFAGDCTRATAVLCQTDTSSFERTIFKTTGVAPALELSSANDSGLLDCQKSTHTINSFRDCWVQGDLCQDLITVRGLVQGIKFDGCFFSPVNSRVIAIYDSLLTASNYAFGLTVENCSFEGNGAYSRMLYIHNSGGLTNVHMAANLWSGDADYLIEVDSLRPGYGIADMTIHQQASLSNPNKRVILVRAGLLTRSSIVCQSGDIDVMTDGVINNSVLRALTGISPLGEVTGQVADCYVMDASPAKLTITMAAAG